MPAWRNSTFDLPADASLQADPVVLSIARIAKFLIIDPEKQTKERIIGLGILVLSKFHRFMV